MESASVPSPPPSSDSILLFASSPIVPSIKSLEDIHAGHTPGGTRTVEFRTTEIDPLSMGAARRALEKRATSNKTLLASKIRARRRISTSGEILKRSKVQETELEKEVHDLKALLTSSFVELPQIKARLDKLEAANPDLYTPLALNRELAVSNLIHSCLRTLDGIVSGIASRAIDLEPLVAPGGPWAKKPLDRLTYTNFWWLYYNQTIYDPTVPLQAYFSEVLGIQIPSPPPSTLSFEVKKSQKLYNIAVNIAIPKVMVPAEDKVFAYMQPIELFNIRTMIGCYLSVFKNLRNDSIHMFERMLSFEKNGRWVAASPSPIENIFLLDHILPLKDLELMRSVLVDIVEHLDELGRLQPLRPLVKGLAECFLSRVVKDIEKPAGWELCYAFPTYWMAPEGEYYYSRLSGQYFRATSEGSMEPYNPVV